ncbi:MAG: SIMPL domain-containing protein [Flavobacteriales bacterium]|nr:MAG: SIMPL domain-containing protein [Flavobacteriales bacterium]
MNHKSSFSSVIIGICLLLGFSLLGFFIYKGFKTFSDKDRVVTVKGLAEMNMTAISSTISLDFSFSGDDLKSIMQQTENKKNAVVDYLVKNGYSKSSIKVNNTDINDRQKYYEKQWQDGKMVPVKIDRYTVAQEIVVQSKEVKVTEDKAAKIKIDLINKNLTSRINTKYKFPELNTIKPKLIAESTKNARIAGEQFANDSQAKLGKIKTASQGQISLAGRYSYGEETTSIPEEPYIQKARVVSRIVFFLE